MSTINWKTNLNYNKKVFSLSKVRQINKIKINVSEIDEKNLNVKIPTKKSRESCTHEFLDVKRLLKLKLKRDAAKMRVQEFLFFALLR